MPKITVPYANLGPEAALIKDELLQAVENVLVSGNYILGPEVEGFEQEFAQYCGTEFAVGVSSGTCALHLVFRALGIGAGHEVITVSNSFIASAAAVDIVGARPVFVDIGSDLNMDPDRLEAAITPKTRAILPVHLTGRVADMDRIQEIADRHSLLVIEDAAQSVGAMIGDRRAGSFALAGCFSLHPLKNLHAFGDAGIVTTNDNQLCQQLRQARNHGFRNRNECDFFSYNCRLDAMQAAMLRVQLRQLKELTEKRRELAFRYNQELKDVVTVPTEADGQYCVYQTYMIQVSNRDELLEFLVECGVDAKVHYPIAIHQQEAASQLGYTNDDLPLTAKASNEIISLPLYPSLTTDQQGHVIASIRKFYEG